MMAEYDVFSKLIEKHGVPRIVIPNTPCWQFTRANSGSYFVSETPPAGMDPLSARVVYCRVPLGNEPFLAIRRYVEVAAHSVKSMRAALLAKGVVEVLRGGNVRGPRGGTQQVTRIAVRDDVSPLGADEFGAALRQRRVLAVHVESSMGDRFLTFKVVTPAMGESNAYGFLFGATCRLADADVSLNPLEGSWSSSADVLNHFRQHFTRPLVP